jgi:hypothetical protein
MPQVVTSPYVCLACERTQPNHCTPPRTQAARFANTTVKQLDTRRRPSQPPCRLFVDRQALLIGSLVVRHDGDCALAALFQFWLGCRPQVAPSDCSDQGVCPLQMTAGMGCGGKAKAKAAKAAAVAAAVTHMARHDGRVPEQSDGMAA